mmetsp:Transcript_35227/g.63994  ORF Transcript_35227/g.63994 Transcript_35227/m.63994 type:complete len:331 (+) Transcript_35227:775-1767(+)
MRIHQLRPSPDRLRCHSGHLHSSHPSSPRGRRLHSQLVLLHGSHLPLPFHQRHPRSPLRQVGHRPGKSRQQTRALAPGGSPGHASQVDLPTVKHARQLPQGNPSPLLAASPAKLLRAILRALAPQARPPTSLLAGQALGGSSRKIVRAALLEAALLKARAPTRSSERAAKKPVKIGRSRSRLNRTKRRRDGRSKTRGTNAEELGHDLTDQGRNLAERRQETRRAPKNLEVRVKCTWNYLALGQTQSRPRTSSRKRTVSWQCAGTQIGLTTETTRRKPQRSSKQPKMRTIISWRSTRSDEAARVRAPRAQMHLEFFFTLRSLVRRSENPLS